MSPVHVLISNRVDDEQQYVAAFGGAVELYRFASNVEAFERLTAAQSPIDLLVITQSQDSLFNLTADQMVSRLTNVPLAANPCLQGMHVMLVDVVNPAAKVSDRVERMGSLEAVIRRVKFGEVQTPSPASYDLSTPARPAPAGDSALVAGLISSIWDLPAPVGTVSSQPILQPVAAAPATARPAVRSSLFVHTAVKARPVPTAVTAPAVQHAPQAQLQPVQPAPQNHVIPVMHAAPPAQPEPPTFAPAHLTAQVEAMVYPTVSADPTLGWSTAVQQRIGCPPVPAQQQPQQIVQPMAHAGGPTMSRPAADGRGLRGKLRRRRERMMSAERAPMRPIAAAPPSYAAPALTAPAQADAGMFQAPQTLLQRAEAAGDVMFG